MRKSTEITGVRFQLKGACALLQSQTYVPQTLDTEVSSLECNGWVCRGRWREGAECALGGRGIYEELRKTVTKYHSVEPREGPGKDGMGDSGWGQECSAWDSVWMLPHGSVECSRVAQQRRKFCSVDSHPGAFYSGPKGSAGICMREVYVWESLAFILDTSPQSSNSLRCWVSEPHGAMWPKWS